MKKTKKEAPIEYGASFSMSIMLFLWLQFVHEGDDIAHITERLVDAFAFSFGKFFAVLGVGAVHLILLIVVFLKVLEAVEHLAVFELDIFGIETSCTGCFQTQTRLGGWPLYLGRPLLPHSKVAALWCLATGDE